MSGEDINDVWYWGPVSGEYVEKILLPEAEGTFVVFKPGGTRGEFTVAVSRDGLFGFTEPLTFEDLNSALDAYNNSQVAQGQLINTLRRPADIPEATANEEDVLNEEFNDIIDLLHYLRKNSKLLAQKADENEQLKMEMKRIDQEIEGKMMTIAGLKKLSSVMEHQKKLLASTKMRSSINQSQNKEFAKHGETINAHLQTLGEQIQEVEADLEMKRNEHSKVSNEHNRCITEISELELKQEGCKSRMEGQPQLLDFVEALLLNDYDSGLPHLDRSTWLKECSNKEVDKLLLNSRNADGTFLVRPHRPRDNIPYCVCVLWTTRSDKKSYKNFEVQDRKVEKFNVVTDGLFFGFDPTTCIFESLDELVVTYSRIPFKVHDLKYGSLTLTYPLFMGQSPD